MQRTLVCPFFRKAFGWCVPIGGLAGLIGLGGGEFRLPVLLHGIGFDAKSAVPLNLMISLVTLTFAMISRSGSVSLAAILPHLPEVIGLAVGGMANAVYGVRLVHRLSAERLIRLIALLLVGIGALLLWEAAFTVLHPTHALGISPSSRFRPLAPAVGRGAWARGQYTGY
jgi:uncharacterized protein